MLSSGKQTRHTCTELSDIDFRSSLAERQNAGEIVVGLARRKAVVGKKLRVAERKARKAAEDLSPHVGFADLSGNPLLAEEAPRKRNHLRDQRRNAIEASPETSDSEHDSTSLIWLDTDFEELELQMRTKIEQEVEEKRVAEQRKFEAKRAAEQQRVQLEADAVQQRLVAEQAAVESYKQSLREKLKQSQQHARDVEDRVKKAFDVALPHEQLRSFVETEQRRDMDDDLGRLLLDNHVMEKHSTTESIPDPGLAPRHRPRLKR